MIIDASFSTALVRRPPRTILDIASWTRLDLTVETYFFWFTLQEKLRDYLALHAVEISLLKALLAAEEFSRHSLHCQEGGGG